MKEEMKKKARSQKGEWILIKMKREKINEEVWLKQRRRRRIEEAKMTKDANYYNMHGKVKTGCCLKEDEMRDKQQVTNEEGRAA